MKKIYFLLIAILALSGKVFSDSRIYILNNTSFNLSFESSEPIVIKQNERKQVLKFSRSSGVKNNKTYYIQKKLHVNNSIINFNYKLIGTSFYSKAFHAVTGETSSDFEYIPFEFNSKVSPVIHKIYFKDKVVKVLYRHLSKNNFADIEYIFNEEVINAPTKENEINILSYNIYMRPDLIFNDHQKQRANRLPEAIKGYDVVVLLEAFLNDTRNILVEKLRDEYPYYTQKLGKDGIIKQDSGVLILSKWPIVEESDLIFKECGLGDCLAHKGAKLIKILKGNSYYNVLGTHVQAFSELISRKVRISQFTQISEFIESMNIPQNEPVILAGDMNVDKLNDPHEYHEMLDKFNAIGADTTFGQNFTFDIKTNLLAEGESQEFLDYLFVRKNNLLPKHSFNRVIYLKSDRPWKVRNMFNESDNDDTIFWDLSDHYPVQGFFSF